MTNPASKPPSYLAPWAQKLAERFATNNITTFLLTGAIRDLQAGWTGKDGTGSRRFTSLPEYLKEEVFRRWDFVITYDRSTGIRAATPEMQRELLKIIDVYDSFHGTTFKSALPRAPAQALPLLEAFARTRIDEGKSVAIIIDYAETIAPAGDSTTLSGEDRYNIVTLTRWAQDPKFLNADAGSLDFALVLLVDNLAELSPRLTRHPRASLIELELPNEDDRIDFIKAKIGGRAFEEVSEVPLPALAQLTAGLSRVQLARIMKEALDGDRIEVDDLKARKKEIIQAECHGLLEFIEPRHGLDVVAGHARAKELLRSAAKALKAGKRDVVPMGFLVSGPIGTGKTFMTTCFAGEIGIPCVKFLNFRSQWQGVTEGNLERIFNILKAMWPVAVIIDEADAMLGNRDASGDSGTSARVFGSIAAFMGNTDYRGKIVWFLLTARPDLLPVDLKRQGRAEEHLALFYPDTPEERNELFRAMAKKTKTPLDMENPASLMGENSTMSGADVESALVRARGRAVAAGRENVIQEDLEKTFADFLPPSYPLEIELQNLAAVVECTSRDLLPEKYRTADRSEIVRKLNELKAIVG